MFYSATEQLKWNLHEDYFIICMLMESLLFHKTFVECSPKQPKKMGTWRTKIKNPEALRSLIDLNKEVTQWLQ